MIILIMHEGMKRERPLTLKLVFETVIFNVYMYSVITTNISSVTKICEYIYIYGLSLYRFRTVDIFQTFEGIH